jgi:hypothetical protein
MNKIIFVLIWFTVISCAIKVKETQLYGKCKTPMYGCTQIKLNNNKTFEFYSFTDVGGGENLIKGTWVFYNKDTLILNSYLKPNKEEIEYEKIFSSYPNPKYIINQLIVLKRNKIIYIPKNKDINVFSLEKIRLNQKKWK